MMTAAINVPPGNAFVKKKKKITLRANVGINSGAVKFTSSLSEIRIFVAEFIWLILSWLLLIHLGIVFSYLFFYSERSDFIIFLIFLWIYNTWKLSFFTQISTNVLPLLPYVTSMLNVRTLVGLIDADAKWVFLETEKLAEVCEGLCGREA